MKLRAELSYKDTWTEIVEIEVPDTATRAEAKALLRRAAERHDPAGPPRSRLSPCNLVHEGWEDDLVFPPECGVDRVTRVGDSRG